MHFFDDTLLPECLERMVGVAEANPSVGVVTSYAIWGREIRHDEGVPYLYVPKALWPAMEDCAAAMGVAAVVLWDGPGGGAFEEAAIPDYVADNRVVFVDVTADWCITCQANKKLVIDQQPVADRLKDGGIVAMQADWTNPDPKIADFLGRHGRYGIPFNVVYGPAAPADELLLDRGKEALCDSVVIGVAA